MENLAKFFFELGNLKRVQRSGWTIAGIKNPESVAEHIWRAALIGYWLAKLEKADADRVMKMLMMHDIPEVRIGDMHKVGARYVDVSKDEYKVVKEQAKCLGKFGKEYIELIGEFSRGKTLDARVARDADLLECAVQAKQYYEIGHKECKEWLFHTGRKLKTKTAKKLFKEIKKRDAFYWWKGLKKV